MSRETFPPRAAAGLSFVPAFSPSGCMFVGRGGCCLPALGGVNESRRSSRARSQYEYVRLLFAKMPSRARGPSTFVALVRPHGRKTKQLAGNRECSNSGLSQKWAQPSCWHNLRLLSLFLA